MSLIMQGLQTLLGYEKDAKSAQTLVNTRVKCRSWVCRKWKKRRSSALWRGFVRFQGTTNAWKSQAFFGWWAGFRESG